MKLGTEIFSLLTLAVGATPLSLFVVTFICLNLKSSEAFTSFGKFVSWEGLFVS